jgi:hypothetical protein
LSKKKLPPIVKNVIRGLPLAGAAVSSLLPLQRTGQQFLILIVLVWAQVYFVLEIFLAGK